MDRETEEFLDLHEHPLMRRVRRAFGVIPIALPLRAIEQKAAVDGVSITDVINKILADENDPESREWLRTIAEEAANNSTCFFRNPQVFDHFRDVTLPALIAANQDTKQLRVWCAGCSTGQEAYTLASILADKADVLPGWDLKVIATDISRSALDEARAGKYYLGPSELLLQGQVGTEEWRDKYLTPDLRTRQWAVKPELKARVDFREHNILDGPSEIGPVDAIFCRHVLMHFTRDRGEQVAADMGVHLPAHGRLYLGRGEAAALSRSGAPAFEEVDTALIIGCFRPLGRPVRPADNDVPTHVPGVGEPDEP